MSAKVFHETLLQRSRARESAEGRRAATASAGEPALQRSRARESAEGGFRR